MSTAPQQPTYIIPPPSSPNWKTPLIFGLIVLLAAANIYLFVQLDRMKTAYRAENAKLSSEFNGAIEKMRIDSSEEVQRSRRSVELLQARLAQQRRAADQAVGQAKVAAEQQVQSLQDKVAQEQAATAAGNRPGQADRGYRNHIDFECFDRSRNHQKQAGRDGGESQTRYR